MATQTGSFDFKAAKEASKTASGYITDITDGICVHKDDDNWDEATGDSVKITDSEVDIVKNGVPVSSFGENEVVVGKNANGKSRAVLSTNGMQVYMNKNGESTQIANLGYGTTQGESGQTTSPYYDLGIRKPNTTKGSYSVAEGYEITASGYYSHAEGSDTYASGSYGSHAEGDLTRAEGPSSHAEGEGTEAGGSESHAEGLNTHAYGMASHAGGCHAEASGDYSFAHGYHIIAAQDYQTVIGEYNIEDTATSDNKKMLFIIGNGAVGHPSNALTVDHKGNVTAAGSITAGGLPSGLLAEDVVLADNKTISGNNYGNGSASVAKTGYTPIGIVGMHLENATSSGTLNTYCMLHSFYLRGTTAYWIVRNTNSGAAKIKVTATILYAKS